MKDGRFSNKVSRGQVRARAAEGRWGLHVCASSWYPTSLLRSISNKDSSLSTSTKLRTLSCTSLHFCTSTMPETKEILGRRNVRCRRQGPDSPRPLSGALSQPCRTTASSSSSFPLRLARLCVIVGAFLSSLRSHRHTALLLTHIEHSARSFGITVLCTPGSPETKRVAWICIARASPIRDAAAENPDYTTAVWTRSVSASQGYSLLVESITHVVHMQ